MNKYTSTTVTKSNKVIALVWAPEERRTQFFAGEIKADLYNVHYLLYKRPWVAPLKYPFQWLKTWYLLYKLKPAVTYVTNPPIFAALSVAIYCFFFRKSRFIMDTHPPSLYSTRWGWSMPLQRLVAKAALINVVDQERFKALFESWNASAMVMSAPLPNQDHIKVAKSVPIAENFVVTVINTFAIDEPVEPILEAARQLPDVHFDILGDTGLASPGLIESAPENVTFTGYMFKNQYWEQLGRSRAVMVLTTYPHSLVLGGQEGMWVGKPLILSRQPSLEEFFTKGTVFVDHTAQDIVNGVRCVQELEEKLQQEVSELAHEKHYTWESSLEELQTIIDNIVSESAG